MTKGSIIAATVILGVLIILSSILIFTNLPETPVIPKCPACSLVCPEPIIQEIEVTKEIEVMPDFKQKVIDKLISEVSEDKSFRICDDDKYSSEEIAVKRVYDGFVLEEDDEGELLIGNVKAKLNYDDGKCYRTFTCWLDSEQEISCE